MQLKLDNGALRRQLMLASCSLLGVAGARGQEAGEAAAPVDTSELTFDSAISYYHEDGRITAIEPIVSLRSDDGNGTQHTLTAVFDSLSGSSPNGALPSSKPQTFATPSGASLTGGAQTYTTASGQTTSSPAPTYVVAPGQLPVDPNYQDTRFAFSALSQQPLHAFDRWRYGGTLSFEHDFLSFAGNLGYSRDFNDKDTTLSAGLNEEYDFIKPIGGAPVPGSDYSLFQKQGNGHKNGIGLQLGVTQVMTRRWLAEFNLTADRFSGYLNDPYKVVSILDAPGDTTGYVNEKRPGERLRRSAYLENRVAFARLTATLAGRYMGDDWGVHSGTLDANLRWWNPYHDRYLQPSVRWYRQSAADFYTPWIEASTGNYSTLESADSRLGAFHATTFGLKSAGAAGHRPVSVVARHHAAGGLSLRLLRPSGWSPASPGCGPRASRRWAGPARRCSTRRQSARRCDWARWRRARPGASSASTAAIARTAWSRPSTATAAASSRSTRRPRSCSTSRARATS